MVENNEDPKMTAFAITVDAKFGTSTGISAGDRATTLRTLADPQVPLLHRTNLNLVSGRVSRFCSKQNFEFGAYVVARLTTLHYTVVCVLCSCVLPVPIALQLRCLFQVYVSFHPYGRSLPSFHDLGRAYEGFWLVPSRPFNLVFLLQAGPQDFNRPGHIFPLRYTVSLISILFSLCAFAMFARPSW